MNNNQLKQTNNIYNDLECWRHPEIMNRIQVMQLNSTKNNLTKYHNTKINLYYEIAVKLNNELDARIYKYNNLYEAFTGCYFLYLLVQKEDYTTIQDYKLFTTIKDGNNKVILEDTTDNFHKWHSTIEIRQYKEIEELQKELNQYKEFINKYNADKQFKEFIKDAKI